MTRTKIGLRLLCIMQNKKQIALFLCAAAIMVAKAADSPYIARVLEYRPAPGQFVNELPEYKAGDNENGIRLKADECLSDDEQEMISLGSWGGYVVFGFDHLVKNNPEELDFQILGNAFVANASSQPEKQGGSSEPGIVMVSYDANGNGRADDEWYELAGSEYYSPETRHNYTVTYYRPTEDHIATPSTREPYLIDTTYIRWRDSEGTTGYVSRNKVHLQSYWPEWIDADSLVFTGTRLADNYADESGNGTYYVQYPYQYGYVDNRPNTDDASSFNIAWAVAQDGTKVNLPGIHFVKVYTGVLQYCGWLGETSTEVLGATDLHLTGEAKPDPFNPTTGIEQTHKNTDIQLLTTLVQNQLIITSSAAEQVQVVDMAGQIMFSANIQPGTSYLPLLCLPAGMYILRTEEANFKFIKQ